MEESNVGKSHERDLMMRFPLLDEELNRLPRRFRVALVACELEGESRREAAAQLGLSEGTLSTHLARGRKCCVSDCSGAASAWPSVRPPKTSIPNLPGMISERLMDSTVQAALGFAARGRGAVLRQHRCR